MKIISVVFIFLISCQNFSQSLTDYVDPFIGTSGTGHTFPGAVAPFGMMQLSPDTGIEGWDWCSGYRYEDKEIIGFTHTHLSGTGGADYGDILLMPTIGKVNIDPKKYRSIIDKKTEKARPGYYSVNLMKHNIRVELTATSRAGLHKYSFPKSNSSNVIIDLNHGISDKSIESKINIESKNTIVGYRRSKGWAENQIVYFVIEFSKPFINSGIALDNKIQVGNKEAKGENVKAFVSFNTSMNEIILAKVGISSVDIQGAKNNLTKELPDWNFNQVKDQTESSWNDALSKIKIEGGTKEQKTIFYTSLYHSFIHPNILSDADGRYRGMDNKIHVADGYTQYTVFSLWDTYRALHPLFTLVQPERNIDMVKSLIAKYNESGILPVWELSSNETGTMIGYHSIPVIADAILKGFKNFDVEKAYKAMLHSANMDHLGLESYKKNNYVASDLEHESVSKTLEYAFDDWCIAMAAYKLGKREDYELFAQRALNYRNLFDGDSGFMRGKKSNGNWVSPFNPFEVTRDFTEANAWQYSMYVPQDIEGLINLFGGDKKFINRLDETFSASSKLEGKMLSDITGMIGQYAHGNEPSHHMAYLYNYTSEPWKTQKTVREILDNLYTDKTDGLIGNDDCGQMSAWYIFSAMGFYPVCPGSNQFVLGSPLFKKITISNSSGTEFVITSDNPTSENYYIKSLSLNGKLYKDSFITYDDIIRGGKLNFNLTSNLDGIKSNLFDKTPYSFTNDLFVSPPYSANEFTYFDDSILVELGCRTDDAIIYYTLDNTEPDQKSIKYTNPFKISNSTTIKAIAYKNGYRQSSTEKIEFNKLNYLQPHELVNFEHGINYKYYEGNFSSVYDIKKIELLDSGNINNFSLSPAKIGDHFGLIFDGFIDIPKTGIYFFTTQSDDGSVLIIDDNKVVDNDGSHAALETSGMIPLQKGFHKIDLLYFEDYEGESLEVGIKGPDLKKQLIPDEMLYRILK